MSTKQDQREVARTVSLLYARKVDGRDHIEDALALHRIAGSLHRYDERGCSEDLGCPTCRGDGYLLPADSPRATKDEPQTCAACAGSGLTIGKRVAKLEAKARGIAAAYGFRLYVQGDPRGCPLYLIPTTYPAIEDACNYNSRGVPVVWLG